MRSRIDGANLSAIPAVVEERLVPILQKHGFRCERGMPTASDTHYKASDIRYASHANQWYWTEPWITDFFVRLNNSDNPRNDMGIAAIDRAGEDPTWRDALFSVLEFGNDNTLMAFVAASVRERVPR